LTDVAAYQNGLRRGLREGKAEGYQRGWDAAVAALKAQEGCEQSPLLPIDELR